VYIIESNDKIII